ncbi:MAG: response regulator, partial [Planctomycetaceae bacterium]|nr:response regulator [Planctomycetaceae bacterium]
MQIRILLAEDDQPIREGVTDALDAAGFAVTAVASGEDALAQLSKSAFDLLLLDIILPGRDGIDVLRQIRAAQPGFPVVLLTAKGEIQDRVRGLELGADDYI